MLGYQSKQVAWVIVMQMMLITCRSDINYADRAYRHAFMHELTHNPLVGEQCMPYTYELLQRNIELI